MTTTPAQTLPRCRRDHPTPAVELHDFGVVDHKGRRIGSRVALAVVTFTPAAEDAEGWGFYRHAPGTFFSFRPHATRDGHAYGASQREQFYATEAQRAAAVAKYLAGARKRVGA